MEDVTVQKFMNGRNVLFVDLEMEARGLRRMADYLYIFGEKRAMCQDYKEAVNFYEKSYHTVRVIGESCAIKGFTPGHIDFLFLNGWWNRKDTKEVLDTLCVYFSIKKDCIIGDKRYIPPCFYSTDRGVKKYKQEDISRFELLDL